MASGAAFTNVYVGWAVKNERFLPLPPPPVAQEYDQVLHTWSLLLCWRYCAPGCSQSAQHASFNASPASCGKCLKFLQGRPLLLFSSVLAMWKFVSSFSVAITCTTSACILELLAHHAFCNPSPEILLLGNHLPAVHPHDSQASFIRVNSHQLGALDISLGCRPWWSQMSCLRSLSLSKKKRNPRRRSSITAGC